MDQSDTVRKQFIFSNISSFFSFFAPERKPQGSSENRMVLTGWQYSLPSCLWSRHCHRATRCFRCSLGCLGICLFWEWGRSEPSSPVIAGGWIVDGCLPSLPCKPLYPWQLILQTRRVTSEVSLKKKKVLQSRYQPHPSNPLLSIISSIYLTSALLSCGRGRPQLLGTHTLGFLLTEFIVPCLSSEW